MNTKTRKAPATTTESNPVRYDAYAVRDYQQDGQPRAEWSRIGVAFPHKDGQGFKIVLNSLPCDGKIVVRIHQPTVAE